MTGRADAVAKAEEYYDSTSAVEFYKNVWGGEDIHIGLYRADDEDIGEASRRTIINMAQRLSPFKSDTKVIDLGAGFGERRGFRFKLWLSQYLRKRQRNAELA